MSAPPPPEFLQAPELHLRRLLLVVTGSASASNVPNWLNWLRDTYADLDVAVVATRSALRFVTRDALALRTDHPVVVDAWEDCTRARHVEHAEWADAVLVYPATFHFVARFALGLADSPALLTLHCTSAAIGLAPALPPGGLDSPAFQRHWATLAQQRNVALVPPMPARSLTTGRDDGWVCPPLPEALRRLEERRLGLLGGVEAVLAGGAAA
ncbi:phosphopantothenoylcysteine synthetase/decarboxylase [Micromonospora luteifusca]|uniref:Phosphopantothenoylcysteine synthetase/decarboxylase n=1 Tax=Micromonospora luteifusca TaxID=709860 RepID=A0ABS2M350_9ACTN|nr:flavoprotein [Micromonospora luteifusca]MBM7494855.1 phosphopantothenoylcysteine synthetase/decarboxylase [Micromonospora luteifusca]